MPLHVCIGAVDAQNWVWDVGTLSWVMETQPTGGGGGGAVTIADGADVAEGSTTDAAVITDTTGTVSSKLRGLVKWAFERMPASLGQKAMAASLPVVLASDQSALAVTVADGADVAEGATTDAAVVVNAAGTISGKLRGLVKWAYERMPASLGQQTMIVSLPVVIASNQSALTVNLPAGAATEGTLTSVAADLATINSTLQSGAQFTQITGSGVGAVQAAVRAGSAPPLLTDNALVVTARDPISTKTDLTPSSPAVTSVGVASASAVAANANRKGLVLTNVSTARISLGFGGAAVLDSGITLYPGGTFEMDEYMFDLGAVNAIASAAASNLGVQEFAT